MAELIAEGPQAEHHWRKQLPSGTEVTLGRDPEKSLWAVPWDQQVSRKHAALIWRDDRLLVSRFPETKNPIFHSGKSVERCEVRPNETFSIGHTRFTVEQPPPPPDLELTAAAAQLDQVKYTEPDERIEILAALPGVIRDSPTDKELACCVLDILFKGVKRADAVAVVRFLPEAPDSQRVEMVAWDRRGGSTEPVVPSRRLIEAAVHKQRQSMIHFWQGNSPDPFLYTAAADYGWAICARLPDAPETGWALYATGRVPADLGQHGGPQNDPRMKSDLKFVELVAQVFGALRQVRELQRMQTHLQRFFSLPVITALSQGNVEKILPARVTDVAVLFCDLRGSSRLAESGNLELTFERLSDALAIITGAISDRDGVIGDFQGDAVMGFWGWPLALDGDSPVTRACRAALCIQTGFSSVTGRANHPLAGFACGIGIAFGPALAGSIGTPHQFKIGVFGHVVNLAARLETMTKQFRTPILLDENAATQLKAVNYRNWSRLRRVAPVCPLGMDKPVRLWELLPPAGASPISDENLRDFEMALEQFIAGNWAPARERFNLLRRDATAAKMMEIIDRHKSIPPADWKGYLVLDNK